MLLNEQFVTCDQGLVRASLVPKDCVAAPGQCARGVYETLLWDRGELWDWEQHLERFRAGCVYAGIEITVEHEILKVEAVLDLLRSNNISDQRCRVRLMGFSDSQPLDDDHSRRFSFLCAVWPAAVPAAQGAGIDVMISEERRASFDQSYNYKLLGRSAVDRSLAVAREIGFNDLIIMNDQEEVCEAAYSNVWVARGGELFTPPLESHCLPGITRDKILKVCNELGIRAHTDIAVTRELLRVGDEVFLSSSVRGLQPVRTISESAEGRIVGKYERNGPVCETLTKTLSKH